MPWVIAPQALRRMHCFLSACVLCVCRLCTIIEYNCWDDQLCWEPGVLPGSLVIMGVKLLNDPPKVSDYRKQTVCKKSGVELRSALTSSAECLAAVASDNELLQLRMYVVHA